MNNLKVLKNILAVVIDADKQLDGGLALYRFKGLFDGLILADVIDFSSKYGELLNVALSTKRKDTAAKNIIYVRSILQSMIKDQEFEQEKLVRAQKEGDDLAIDSTCVIVTGNENKEVQLQLTNMPKKLGRPKSNNALSGAERAKKARDKKKANKLVTVNSTLSERDSILYNQMIENGFNLNSIISMAYSYSLTLDK